MKKWFYTDEEFERAKYFVGVVALFFFLFVAVSLNPTHERDKFDKCKIEAAEVYADRIESLTQKGNQQVNPVTKANYEQEYLENKVACNNLDAQWSLAVVTYFAFCVGIIGIILVFLTLRATRETIKVTRNAAKEQILEAEKATNAAWASVEESKSQFRREMQPGLIVTDVESFDFHMARKVNYSGEQVTELEVMAMELQEEGPYWHKGLWCKVKLRVRNWGKLPIHGIEVKGTFSISSGHHNRPHVDEKPGIIIGRHDFIAPETEDTITLSFCYASFYSDHVQTTDNDPFSGRTRLILDDCFLYIIGEVYFKDQFTDSTEIRVLNFSWGDTYNPQYNMDKKKQKVSMRPIRTIKMQ